jgi:hypothetical protein
MPIGEIEGWYELISYVRAHWCLNAGSEIDGWDCRAGGGAHHTDEGCVEWYMGMTRRAARGGRSWYLSTVAG